MLVRKLTASKSEFRRNWIAKSNLHVETIENDSAVCEAVDGWRGNKTAMEFHICSARIKGKAAVASELLLG